MTTQTEHEKHPQRSPIVNSCSLRPLHKNPPTFPSSGIQRQRARRLLPRAAASRSHSRRANNPTTTVWVERKQPSNGGWDTYIVTGVHLYPNPHLNTTGNRAGAHRRGGRTHATPPIHLAQHTDTRTYTPGGREGRGGAPSQRPHWPGREAMAAKRRPDLNWSATCGSMVLLFLPWGSATSASGHP
jgi:hypothetical protein